MMLHLRLPVHTLNIPHIYFYKVMQDSDALCLIQSLPPGVLYKSNIHPIRAITFHFCFVKKKKKTKKKKSDAFQNRFLI